MAGDALAEGLSESEAQRTTTRAMISLALALSTWRLLTDDGLSDDECVQLFVGMVRSSSNA